MTIDEARDLYDKHEGEKSFAAHVVRCLFHGVLVKRDEFLLMAEPVFTDGKRILPIKVHNCWWVYYVVAPEGTGTPSDFMAEAPYPLPFIGFKRRGKIKIYPWEKLRREFYAKTERVLVR